MKKVINFIGLDELLYTDAPKYSQFRRSQKKITNHISESKINR